MELTRRDIRVFEFLKLTSCLRTGPQYLDPIHLAQGNRYPGSFTNPLRGSDHRRIEFHLELAKLVRRGAPPESWCYPPGARKDLVPAFFLAVQHLACQRYRPGPSPKSTDTSIIACLYWIRNLSCAWGQATYASRQRIPETIKYHSCDLHAPRTASRTATAQQDPATCSRVAKAVLLENT